MVGSTYGTFPVTLTDMGGRNGVGIGKREMHLDAWPSRRLDFPFMD